MMKLQFSIVHLKYRLFILNVILNNTLQLKLYFTYTLQIILEMCFSMLVNT